MLKKLQRRFMLIAMFALASLTIVQTIGVNVINIYQRDSDLRAVLEIIAKNRAQKAKIKTALLSLHAQPRCDTC